MEQAIETAPSASFARVLASLAGSLPGSGWKDGDLADDVATLSYESALRAHARYRAEDGVLPPAPAPPEDRDAPHAVPAKSSRTPPVHSDQNPLAVAFPDSQRQDLRTSSVTLRMSRAEYAQLHQRAGESGLTVSAYLRACAFEAETLRAMVKDAMAELRRATEEKKPPAAVSRTEKRSWFARMLPPRSAR